MIQCPCGVFNNNSPCMSDGKCMKRYPRTLVAETITGHDNYPLYRRRSTEHGGKSITLTLRNNDVEVIIDGLYHIHPYFRRSSRHT